MRELEEKKQYYENLKPGARESIRERKERELKAAERRDKSRNGKGGKGKGGKKGKKVPGQASITSFRGVGNSKENEGAESKGNRKSTASKERVSEGSKSSNLKKSKLLR